MGISERRRRDGARLRQKILNAARDLFAAQGYEAVTMREIARKIEYSPTAIYTHFQDKEALINELALAQRDILRLRQSTYRDLAQSASVVQSVATRSEVKFKSTVSVAAIQKQADQLARELRDLDARIQEANWKIELEK